MEELTRKIFERLDDAANAISAEFEDEYGCEAGDISPEQAIALDHYLEEVAKILAQVVRQNM